MSENLNSLFDFGRCRREAGPDIVQEERECREHCHVIAAHRARKTMSDLTYNIRNTILSSYYYSNIPTIYYNLMVNDG